MTGTFPPGEAEMTYRYQVPLGGETAQRVRLPLPPRVVASRVVIGAGPNMGMQVAGYPNAKPSRWHDGKRVLETSKKVDAQRGMQTLLSNTAPDLLDIQLSGLPMPGPQRKIALFLALASMLGGALYFSQLKGQRNLLAEQREDFEEARDALLAEIARLERARNRSEVGPRMYDKLRGALLDALARIVSKLEQKPTQSPVRRPATSSAAAADATKSRRKNPRKRAKV
jgi:hypothetical protein